MTRPAGLDYQPTKVDNPSPQMDTEVVHMKGDTPSPARQKDDKTIRKSNTDEFDDLIRRAKKRNQPRNFCFQLCYLFVTSMQLFFKNKIFLIMSTMFLFIMNGVIMLLYLDLGDIDEDTYTAILNRQGLLFILSTMAFFTGANSTLLGLLPKRKLYVKDQHGRYYNSFAFYLSQQIVNMPVFGVSYLLVCIAIHYALGLNTYPDISTLFYFYFFIFVGAYFGGSSLGFLIGSIASDMETAATLIPLMVLPLMLCNGFFGNLKDSSIVIQGISYISPPKFFFQGLTLNEFQNHQEYKDNCSLPVPCPPGSTEETCYVKRYNDICDPLQTADYYEDKIWQNVVGTLVLIVVLRILGYIVFVALNRQKILKSKDNPKMRKQIQEFLNLAINIDLDESVAQEIKESMIQDEDGQEE